jgi:hypothetical protein
MSYTTKEKNNAIILIGEYGSASISNELYEDLQKFNLIIITRKEGVPAGARLTYSGNELFLKLKNADEYLEITKKDFSKLFNGITFKFRRHYHTDNYPCYYISFNNNGSNAHFKMHRKTNHEWVIENTTLPGWVKEMEMEFSTAIANNEIQFGNK